MYSGDVCYRLLVVLFIPMCIVRAGTVLYTNSPSQIRRSGNAARTKTYELNVPGSSPIRIIEAVDQWGEDNANKSSSFVEEGRRTTKDFKVPGSSIEQSFTRNRNSNRFHYETSPNTETINKTSKADRKTTVYSPHLLNAFLEEYSKKIKNANSKTKSKLHQIPLEMNADNNRKVSATPDSLDLKTGYIWDLVNVKKHHNPYEDKDGWVSLDAVPWSTSKISKWHSRPSSDGRPDNYRPGPWDDSDHDVPRPIKNPYRPEFPKKPHTVTRPEPDYDDNPPYYTQRPYEYQKPDLEYAADIPPRPFASSFRPESWYEKPKPQKPHCDDDTYHGYSNNKSPYQEKDDIITDGLPGNFPPMRGPTPLAYAGLSAPSDDHPSSHPSNGNGEWVLISTTKGYQKPRTGERSMAISPDLMTSTQAVKLTVLPSLNTTDMTTSHGGMLEVQSSFQTVEESMQAFVKGQAQNSTKIRLKKPKPQRTMKFTPVQVQSNPGHDSAAVLAAVGAGLLPATMAMVMPMVLGKRRKRSTKPRINYFSNDVTQNPRDYESVIQRSLYR